MTEYSQVRELAIEKYMEVLHAHHVGFYKPPTIIRDKKWSRYLKSYWPNFTIVELDKIQNFIEMENWCNDQKSGFWYNGAKNKWYFDNKNTALMFKLKFGGTINETNI